MSLTVVFSSNLDYPWDRSNLKSLEIDLKDFKELDRFASEVQPNFFSVRYCIVNLFFEKNVKKRFSWL